MNCKKNTNQNIDSIINDFFGEKSDPLDNLANINHCTIREMD